MHHVTLHCENHPENKYHCKSIAVNDSGRYNGCRNIFPYDKDCSCTGASLIITDIEELKKAREAE